VYSCLINRCSSSDGKLKTKFFPFLRVKMLLEKLWRAVRERFLVGGGIGGGGVYCDGNVVLQLESVRGGFEVSVNCPL
jgi:hypothetical protein